MDDLKTVKEKISKTKILRYRELHPRCRYCAYKKRKDDCKYVPGCSVYYVCCLKDKYLYDSVSFLIPFRGMFCEWFEVDDEI